MTASQHRRLPAATEPTTGVPERGEARLVPLLRRDLGLDGCPCARPDLSDDWIRVASGVYAPRGAWQIAAPQDRQRFLIAAARRRYGSDLVLSGASAVVAYGLPLVGAAPRRVDVIVRRRGRAYTSLLRRHLAREEVDVVRVGDQAVAVLPDTLVDLARWHGVMAGVAAMDAALNQGMCGPKNLRAALERLPAGSYGAARARCAVHLADGRSESPGESMSRVRVWENMLPQPELQVTVHAAGQRYVLDYFWPGIQAAGEFDGRVKYRSTSFGADPEDVLWNEKLREDAIRAEGLGVARWTWMHAWSDGGRQMCQRLAGIGVVPVAKRW
ncbi:hypothetical protein [Actinomyces lilanjuaniae]|uniref:hypothetical protein n=1 Tax=Actinomyces lilanjuaniae TaxID=2321394 RepID=UPI001FAAFC76|nr:hypothetical protein [Actinomyces lilanjuaniae]